MSTDMANAPQSDTKPAAVEHDITQSLDVDVTQHEVTPPTGEQIAEQLDDMTESIHSEVGSPPKHDQAGSSRPASSDAQPDSLEALRQQAQQFGFTAEDVQSLDATALRNVLDVQANLFRAQQVPQPPQQFMPPQWPPQQPPLGYGQPPQQPQVQPFKFDLPKEVYDEKLVDQLNAAAERMAAHEQMLLQQQQALASQQQYAAQMQHQAMMARQQALDEADSRDLDSWIDGLGASFQPVFGGKDIQANSPGFRARAAMFQEMRNLQQQYAVARVNVSPDTIKEQAARRVLGQQYDFFKQQEQRKPIQQRQQQFVNRANGQVARKPGTGLDAAAKRLEDFMSQKGL